jgi:hypothetical protein
MLAVLLTVLVVCGPPGAAAELAPADGALSVAGGGRLEPAEKPPRELAKQPAYKSEKPLYVVLPTGGHPEGGIVAALDESGGTGTGYDTLHLDANNNGDLTDDGDVEVDVRRQGRTTLMVVKRAEITVKYEDGARRRLAAALAVYAIRDPSAGHVFYARVMILQHLEGKVDFEGGQLLVGLYDGADRTRPANARFNDFGVDRLRIDTDGDGKLGESEEVVLSRLLPLGGKLYGVEVNASATSLAIKPYAGEMGDLRVSVGFAEGAAVTGGRLTFAGKDGVAVSWEPAKGRVVRLPAGSFRIGGGALALSDASGSSWLVRVSGSNLFEVPAKGTAELKLGSPLTAEPVINGQAVPGGRVAISYRLLGAAGEAYEVLYRAMSALPPPPRVLVEDAAGGRLAGGEMEYG